MSKKSRQSLQPTPNCADAYTDNLKSSQQSDDSKHSLTQSQAVNHPYFLPQGLLPSPRAREGNDGEGEKAIAHGLKHGYLDAKIASCSQEASPASPSVMPDESVERQTVATSGLRLLQLSKQSSPIGLFLRTLLDSSIWYSPIVKLEWQAKPLFAKFRMTKSQITTLSQEELTETSQKQGMKQFGLLYQLAVSVRPTEGTEYGLSVNGFLKTPTASEGVGGAKTADKYWDAEAPKIKLRDQIAKVGLLHTPSGQEPGVTSERLVTKEGEPAKIGERAYDKETGRLAQVGLTQQINMGLLPTHQTMDVIGMTREVIMRGNSPRIKSNQGIDGQAGLRDVVASAYQTGTKTGMKLQPAFVEWMMGYPESWTELTD